MRRQIGTAHNFANKPVFFACNGVQIRRRVSYKAGTKESDRTTRNSRNASRVRKKILPKAVQRVAGVPGDRRKARRRVVHGAASRAHNGGEAAHRGGGYGGRERRQEQEWKAGRHDEAKKFGVAYWCRCSSSRVRVYIYY